MKTSFLKYHIQNPKIYLEFEKLAYQLINKGYVRLGAKQIFEVIRWHTMVEGTGQYKVNNNFTSDYARLFEWYHPIYKGYFNKRLCKSI